MIDRFRGSHAFLSNFSRDPITYEGVTYPTVEHAYQASKCTSLHEKIRIAQLVSPREAKWAGRAAVLASSERYRWDAIKIEVMRQLLRLKFSNPVRQDQLLGTGDEELVEGNEWGDTFWGVCRGVGQNWLGKLLMEVRAELKGRAA